MEEGLGLGCGGVGATHRGTRTRVKTAQAVGGCVSDPGDRRSVIVTGELGRDERACGGSAVGARRE